MRLYLASTTSTRSALRGGLSLTRATRPAKAMPAFGPVDGQCRCGAARTGAARNHPWRDCPACRPALATR